MGKTTVSKFLFANYPEYSDGEYPVFASLTGKRLSELNWHNVIDFIADEMYADFKKSYGDKPNISANDYFVREYFKGFLSNNKTVLILDGIDEAIFGKSGPQDSLRKFAELLRSLPWTYFLTSRKEFYPFFDVFESSVKNQDHLVVELMPWGQKQWSVYIRNLRKKFPEKSHHIGRFADRLENKEYGELPERPLFLKMISDLELDNETNLEIPLELRSNRAQIYHSYIKLEMIMRERVGTVIRLHLEKSVLDCFKSWLI
jgi:hypothetical protein